MSDAHDPQSAGLKKTVIDAQRLLDYAVGRGLIKDTFIITAIINIEAKLASGATPAQSNIEDFLKAYNTLSEVTGGVSGDSLSPEADSDATRTRKIYTAALISLLVFLVPISTITLTGKRLIEETLADIEYVCKDQKVKCSDQLYEPNLLTAQAANGTPSAPPLKVQTAISSDSGPPPKVQAAISNSSELSAVQAANGNSSNLSSGGVSSPVAKTLYDTSNRTNQIQRRMKRIAYTVIFLNSPPQTENDPIVMFHATRVYADTVRNEFNLWYETVAGCLLPIAFAALGAVTFGLRDLRQRLEDRTWTKQGQALPFLRIVIALLVGFLISLFTDFSTKTGLTPIALAFVLGYSVDVFFTFIDSIVTRLKTPVTAPAKPAGV